MTTSCVWFNMSHEPEGDMVEAKIDDKLKKGCMTRKSRV